MKLVVNQKQLALAIKAVSKTLSRRPHLPILSGIHLEATDNQLEISTTDLIAGIKVIVPATIDLPGKFVVSGKTLVESIGFFDQEETSFELKEKELLVRNGKDRVLIPLLTEDYPLFNLPKLTSKTLPLPFWENLVKKVAFAASSDQSRPALTGILLRCLEDSSQIVCTDGFRLSVLSTKETLFASENPDLIISAKAIIDAVALAQIFSLEELNFSFDSVGEQICFSGVNFNYFSKVINSNYPPFEKIIPLEFATEITIDRQNFVRNLNKAAVFARANNNIVKLGLENQSLFFTAASMGDGNFKGEQDLDSKTGADLEIAFNIRYLLDFLNTCTHDQVWLGFNSSASPAMIKDLQDSGLQYIAMPFKAKN